MKQMTVLGLEEVLKNNINDNTPLFVKLPDGHILPVFSIGTSFDGPNTKVTFETNS